MYEAEYHHMFREVDDVSRRAAVKLADHGIRAMDVGSSYPSCTGDVPVRK